MPSDLAHTMLQDLGTELCVLVYHLFQGRRPAPEAFVELARRTRKTVDVQETQHVSALADLPRTSWYTEMARCYDGVRRTTMTKHASDFAEVEDLTRDMCPNDCAASSLIDSIQNIVALLTCSISEADLEAFVNHMCEVHRDATSVSTTELIRALSDNLLMDALIPRGWWNNNNNNNNEVSGVAGPDDEAYACRRVRLRSSPPEMVIEYRDHATIRHRRIDLRDVLHTHGQIGPLARRLAASHGWLLSEADIQRLLIKLQREMQRAESMAEEEVAAGDDDDDHHRKPAEAAPSSSSSSIHAQKNNNNDDDDAAAATGISSQQADLGLLYRDPELALKNVDLNGADDITVQEFKEVMNHTFLAAVVKPGEEGYQYDKRVEVAPPTQKSEWDDSDEDEDEDDGE